MAMVSLGHAARSAGVDKTTLTRAIPTDKVSFGNLIHCLAGDDDRDGWRRDHLRPAASLPPLSGRSDHRPVGPDAGPDRNRTEILLFLEPLRGTGINLAQKHAPASLMTAQLPISLASYPRSGNTLLRTILFHCFGLRTGSIYPNDLGRNEQLEQTVGHIEQDGDGRIAFPDGAIPLVKTHKPPIGSELAIYIVRDGLKASLSLRDWASGSLSIEAIVRGATPHGTWSDHLMAWKPWERPATLFLRYEEVITDLPATIEVLAAFLQRDPLSHSLPPRDEIADGRWIRKRQEIEETVAPQDLDLFEECNGPMMRALGYWH